MSGKGVAGLHMHTCFDHS
uniref:Uncharacterized protein n=1 Tax=Arundo donax TaxID=35708 RepID=A0A0A9EJH9_ARUDO